MADLGYFSDTDDSAVDELISQAKELCVLEQVSAINCSDSTDSLLPTDLEQRFRKLKSFPATKPKPSTDNSDPHLGNSLRHSKSEMKYSEEKDHKAECQTFSDPRKNQVGKMSLEGKPEPQCDLSPLNSLKSSPGSHISSDSKQNPGEKTNMKEKSKPGSVSVSVSKLKSNSKSCSSSFSSSNSWMGSRSPSPPQKAGCLWCSPKSGSKKKSKENRLVSRSLDWGKTDEFLSDLSTFSSKEQQKMLKKAMKEEEKVSREAEKIVKWAKQASMRMRVHGSEDELSD